MNGIEFLVFSALHSLKLILHHIVNYMLVFTCLYSEAVQCLLFSMCIIEGTRKKNIRLPSTKSPICHEIFTTVPAQKSCLESSEQISAMSVKLSNYGCKNV